MSTGAPRLRVVTLIDTVRAAGGAERLATTLAMRLDPDRFQSTLCTSRAPLPDDRAALRAAEAEARERGVAILRLERQSVRDVAAWRPLWSLLRRSGVDVVHAHMPGSNLWGTVLGRLAGVPVVIAHEHGSPLESALNRRLLDKHLVGRGADAFLAASRADRTRLAEADGLGPGKVIYLPNGIDVPQRAPDRDIRAELGIPRDAQVLGAVGVLRPEKTLDVLIRAAASLRDRFPRLRVVLVGAGPEEAELRTLARSLGVEDTVIFTGIRSDVPDLLGGVDVAVCCSEREGMPLSVLEYMDAGVPIVCTRVGGLPDMVEDGVSGLLVEPHDADGLAAAVARLLEDSELAAALGTRARERRRSEFSMEAMLQRLERLYEDLYRAKEAQARRYRPLRAPSEQVRLPVTG